MANKEISKRIKLAKKQGWEIFRRGNNHYLWESPTGERVITSSTPSDARALKNIDADLRKAGLDLSKDKKGRK